MKGEGIVVSDILKFDGFDQLKIAYKALKCKYYFLVISSDDCIQKAVFNAENKNSSEILQQAIPGLDLNQVLCQIDKNEIFLLPISPIEALIQWVKENQKYLIDLQLYSSEKLSISNESQVEWDVIANSVVSCGQEKQFNSTLIPERLGISRIDHEKTLPRKRLIRYFAIGCLALTLVAYNWKWYFETEVIGIVAEQQKLTKITIDLDRLIAEKMELVKVIDSIGNLPKGLLASIISKEIKHCPSNVHLKKLEFQADSGSQYAIKAYWIGQVEKDVLSIVNSDQPWELKQVETEIGDKEYELKVDYSGKYNK